MPDTTDRKVALVTGASYGVGAATALALARDGFDLVVTATRADNLAATVGELAKIGCEPLPLALDLHSQESIETVVANALERFRPEFGDCR